LLIFFGGFLFSRKISPVAINQTDFYKYFSIGAVDGYGTIKSIDPSGSTVTISSQTQKDKTSTLKIGENSRYYQIINWDANKGIADSKLVELKDLKVNDDVYFVIHPNEDGTFNLIWLNIKGQ